LFHHLEFLARSGSIPDAGIASLLAFRFQIKDLEELLAQFLPRIGKHDPKMNMVDTLP